jgi:3-hydroxy-3-methylglutaryl CoA synthase
MIGITSFGAYIPATRLALGAIGGREARDGGPEKAVAWNDEDSVTMGVTAAVNCLRGFDRAIVDSVLFASTTYPFREKQGAALIARALDLRRDIQATDVSSSLRAGTSALRAGFDSVAAGSARNVLVVASDARTGAPGSGLERNGGDGAAAFLVGSENVIATLEAAHAVSDAIVDLWRVDGDPFVHTWEDRFVIQEGYTPCIEDAIRGLLERSATHVGDYATACLYAPDARSHAGVARSLGIKAEQLGDPLFGRLGNAGAAFAPLQFAAALESSKPGDALLIANYGDGADALAFSVTESLEKLDERRGVAWHLARRRGVTSYDKYLKARNLNTQEWAAGSNPGLSATVHYRERDDDLSFRGQKCTACSAVQFPAQRVCASCFAKDQFEPVRLSDQIGSVVTYTFDYFFPTPDPPTVVSIVDIAGARVHLQLSNCAPDDVHTGMEVEFEFRRIHEGGGRPNYYWKGTPVPS